MFPLPRGAAGQPQQARTATARWARPDEVLPYRYQDGDIFMGFLPVPTKAAARTIQKLETFIAGVQANTALEAAWRDAQAASAWRRIAQLATTSLVPIGVRDDRHLVTAAGSRAGKGTSAIIPNLCLYPGSVIVIDPKGENARLTAARRGRGSPACAGLQQRVCVLDPYGASGVAPELLGAWNPFDLLRGEDEQIVDHAASIASALVVPGKADDAHFDETARIFIKALILYVALENEGRPDRTLLTVYDLLMRGARGKLEDDRVGPAQGDDPSPFQYLLHLMAEDGRLNGVIAAAASTLLDMGDRELGSVLSTARRNLEWLERPAMRRVVARSTIDLTDLKTAPEGVSLYLCLPPQRMVDCGRWLRLVIAAALERAYVIEAPPATGHPILFLLEEFPTLKHMEIIETAAGYAAGFGIKLWIIVQDLSQMKRWYKDGWETFIGNAGVIQAFGNSDATTLEYLSKRLGELEVSQSVLNTTTSLSASSNDAGDFQRASSLIQNRGPVTLLTNPFLAAFNSQSTGQSATTTSAVSQQIKRTPLLLPDEVERHFKRGLMTQIVSIKGENPMALARVNYYEAPEFMSLYEPDRPPFHSQAEAEQERARRLTARERQTQTTIAEAETFIDETERAIAQVLKSRR